MNGFFRIAGETGSFHSPFSFSFPVSFWFLILTLCFHFTARVITDAFVFSLSILFHNAALTFVYRSASQFSASSSLAHLNCDVLGQWLVAHSHGIRRFANAEIIMMHKVRIVCRKERNEIEIARSIGEKLTI
jgi:hypothetical protein